MGKRMMGLVLGVASFSALGGAAYAVSRGADDRPARQVVPAAEVRDDRGGDRPAGVSDDPVTHDVGDDRGGDRPAGVSDDPVTHDVGDDRGGDRDRGGDDDGDRSGRGGGDDRSGRGGGDDDD